MKKILEQLYEGELAPHLEFAPTIQQYKENHALAFRSYHAFLEKLPKDLQYEFKQLIDQELSLLPFELEQTFIDGFSMGVRMMAEVFTDPVQESLR
ncbi:MAG: hypothetical protein HFE39_10195 [Clostridiales bacterium]|jgi:hypothetical protein|nr:hypothetical protein [Clostridiales bacterium]